MLAAICHDLRAPLAAVTMGANFVLQTTPDEPENARSRRILEAMLRSCTHMERLVRNFADLAEIEGNGVALRLGLHDAGEMLELAAGAAMEGAKAKSVALDVAKPNEPLTLRCDRDRLLRAIGHMIENAIKYAPKDSAVYLGVSERQGQIIFSVRDHGPGLTAQVRRNLFNRHWHARRANRVGAGFGLAIARGFVAAHGGRIRVAPATNEPGTTFQLIVPRQPPDARAPAHEDAMPARPSRAPRGSERPSGVPRVSERPSSVPRASERPSSVPRVSEIRAPRRRRP